MHTFQKRLFASAAIVAAAGVAAYWYWSPYVVVHQMRNAAIDADADSFNDHVDYPQLRDSLKGQLSARITGEMANRPHAGNAFEQAGNAFGSMLGLALVDRMVDAVVRPETVMLAMRQGRFQRDAAAPQDAADGNGDQRQAGKVSWHMERKGIDKVWIHVDDADSGKPGPAFVMRRDGFANWKLIDIRLP